MQQLPAEFQETDAMRAPHSLAGSVSRCRRTAPVWRSRPARGPAGVPYAAKRLRRNHVIRYSLAHRIMGENCQAVPPAAKPKRRKRIRFERKYSNAMWHADWHEMKDPRFRGLCLVTYLDDSSRCIMAARVFTQATSENAVLALRDAIGRFGTPATILSGSGPCFVGRNGRKKAAEAGGTRQPTPFEAELLNRGIEMINSRPHRPRTSGKLKRLYRSIESEIWHHDSVSEYVRYYNEERLHGALDIDDCEVPLQAFGRRRAGDATRKNSPRWMEEDSQDRAKQSPHAARAGAH